MILKLLLSLLLLACSQISFAETISEEEAQQKATAFLQQRLILGPSHRTNAGPALLSNNKAPLDANYYVFNIGMTDGFLVMSSDDHTPEILGYADEGTFDAANMPENMKAWLQGYTDQLTYLKKNDIKRTNRAPQLDEHRSILPLLTCNWNQDAPFNNNCPYDGTERSVTGCVATAMAQVLYYHKHPARTTSTIPAYQTETKNISVGSNTQTAIDWANMVDNYSGNETNSQKKAVATLMKLCGSSVKMDYTNEASAAHSSAVPVAFKTYFDYDAATTLVSRDDYRARDWDNLIYNEIANSRPVYYSGSSAGGAHAFVIDGYSKDGLYHVNWGWGGANNGYFLLSVLDPGSNNGIGASTSSDGYSLDHEAMIGAEPKTGVTPDIEVKMYTQTISTQQPTVNLTNGRYKVTVNNGIYSAMEETYLFDIGLGVFNDDNELLYAQLNGDSIEIKGGWGWNSLNLTAYVPSLPDGIYQIAPISRETGTEIWYRNTGGPSLFITSTISNGVMTLQDPTIDLAVNIETSGSYEVNSPIVTSTSITNNGTLYFDRLHLEANNEKVGGRYFELSPGKTDTLFMDYTPTETGTTTLEIGYYTYTYDQEAGWESHFHALASKNVTVIAPKDYTLQFSNGSVTNASYSNINSDTAKIRMTIRNAGNNNYNDVIRTYAYRKDGSDDYFYYENVVETPLKLTRNQRKTLNIEVPLKEDGYYWFITVYKTSGEFIDINSEYRYAELYGYTVTIPSPGTAITSTYNEVMAEAREILDDEAYAIVTGDERTVLSSAVETYSDITYTDDQLTIAIKALRKAINNFRQAKPSYSDMADILALIGVYQYASEEKAAAIEPYKDYMPKNSAEIQEMLSECLPQFRAYAESSALLEGVYEASNQTKLIKNPNALSNLSGWSLLNDSSSHGSLAVLNNNMPIAANHESYKFFYGGDPASSSWNVTIQQSISLPKGKYQLTVCSMASEDLSTFRLFADNAEVEMKHRGTTCGLFGLGWNDHSLEFEVSETKYVNIGIQGIATAEKNWMAFTRFRLAMFPESETEGIAEINVEVPHNAIYNLNGQKVEKVRKGLYIISTPNGYPQDKNSKKVLMK